MSINEFKCYFVLGSVIYGMFFANLYYLSINKYQLASYFEK